MTKQQISFKTTNEEFQIINKIAERAVNALDHESEYPKQMCLMDLVATHCNGNPLDLEGLLAAGASDFVHDVFGIRRHIDRDTGRLMDCFVPRYSRRA